MRVMRQPAPCPVPGQCCGFPRALSETGDDNVLDACGSTCLEIACKQYDHVGVVRHRGQLQLAGRLNTIIWMIENYSFWIVAADGTVVWRDYTVIFDIHYILVPLLDAAEGEGPAGVIPIVHNEFAAGDVRHDTSLLVVRSVYWELIEPYRDGSAPGRKDEAIQETAFQSEPQWVARNAWVEPGPPCGNSILWNCQKSGATRGSTRKSYVDIG